MSQLMQRSARILATKPLAARLAPRNLRAVAAASATSASLGDGAASVLSSRKKEHSSFCWASTRAFSSTPSDGSDSADAPAAESEPPKGESLEFQAETKQLLDIVTHSLYTDKEVFIRELVSNASYACEKLRHWQQTEAGAAAAGADSDSDLPLEIHIDADEVTSSITIRDTGIGMTKEEMISNLGTIAKSGSKQFLQELSNASVNDANAKDEIGSNIIGKFGVGFYSSFMVADSVQVRSKSAKHPDQPPMQWLSDGHGSFTVSEVPPDARQDRGTSITLFLKPDFWPLVDEKRITTLLQTYSNFVQFPIYVHGSRINTIQAVWAQDPKEVEEDTYIDFYRYITKNPDAPMDTYHFRSEAPLDVKALLYIPSFHSEKFGMQRLQPGVDLYSRKVLIEAKSTDILPDWMRFVKGVVDSEDVPLSVSREKPQDTALIAKLRKALTRKFISHLEKMNKKEKDRYLKEFYAEYAFFLKEGVCQDFEFQAPLSKLLYFETNKSTKRDLISLDEYVSKMRPEQNEIYYLCSPTREAAALSPYLEAFEKANVEVIFVYSAIDDFVMANIANYEGRPILSVEKSNIDLSKFDDDKDGEESEDKDDVAGSNEKLTDQEIIDFCVWFRQEVGDEKVASCKASTRLVSSPAIVTDNESGAMRRMMRMVDTSEGGRNEMALPKQHVEINPKHPIVVGMAKLRESEPILARILAEQVYDNCLVAAGLMDDSRTMLPRLNDLLVSLVKGAQQHVAEKEVESENDADASSKAE